jgi:glycosyltransferase involved in cell wall biosynthesis
MTTHNASMHSRGIAFLGTYVPQQCGIATFTDDLSTAVIQQVSRDQSVGVIAMKDRPEGYDWSDRVKFEIRRDHQIDYARAADFMNFSRTGVLSLQHEYGIFGGEYGSNILTLLRELRRPVVVTCHTVLRDPTPGQKEVFNEIIARADRIVVMTQKAFDILEQTYDVDGDKAVLIPHGIHDVPFVDSSYYKDNFGVEGRRVLLTFGLLSRNKGIENVIEALPEIVSRHPRVTYLVLGATHPSVVKEEGESYRLELQRRIRELGLEEHVLFHPRFVELEELLEYIGATDIFVAPYHNLDQITSGALSYAMGAGKAVVSTPFWHAEELLADGRGRLVPVRDAKAIAREINGLLDDEVALSSMRKRAYQYCRHMVWSSVARQYLQLFDTVRTHTPVRSVTASALRRPISATNLVTPKIDHLDRLSDDTGPAHHAHYTIPDWSYGYRIEDAAAALVAAIKYQVEYNDETSQRLSEVYLSLVHSLVGDGRAVAAGMTYARHSEGNATDAGVGMVLWGLGYVIRHESLRLAESALDSFNELLPRVAIASPRGAGYAALGAADYLARFPGASDVMRFLRKQTDILAAACTDGGWLKSWDGADWALPAQALAVAGRALNDDTVIARAAELSAELIDYTGGGSAFRHPADPAADEESPVSAAVFVEALTAVYNANKDQKLLAPIRTAADWFLGNNRLGIALYDFSTGGCHDALMATGLNRNQGTVASVYCMLAFMTLHKLAGLDIPEVKSGGTG